MEKLYFAALRPGAKIPAMRDEDAGYDIYACFDEDYIKIPPHETKIIPSGIISAFPPEYVAILKERGSTGIRGIGQRSGVIDSGYRGEWLISLTNHNEAPLLIAKSGYAARDGEIVYPYEKAICQAVFVPLARLEAAAVTPEFVRGIGSERGAGRLGSSEK
jgi:dUTP pyrophosphatase